MGTNNQTAFIFETKQAQSTGRFEFMQAVRAG